MGKRRRRTPPKKSAYTNVEVDGSYISDEVPEYAGISKTGKRKIFWFHEDEVEALREAAYRLRRSEASLVREAVRKYFGIED